MLRRDLRKGQSNIYLKYESGSGDSIGVRCAEAELRDGVVIVRFQLYPVDDNQRMDLRSLDREELVEVHISDNFIMDNLAQFLRQPYVVADALALEFTYGDKRYKYPISLGSAGLGFLPLMVTPNAS